MTLGLRECRSWKDCVELFDELILESTLRSRLDDTDASPVKTGDFVDVRRLLDIE